MVWGTFSKLVALEMKKKNVQILLCVVNKQLVTAFVL